MSSERGRLSFQFRASRLRREGRLLFRRAMSCTPLYVVLAAVSLGGLSSRGAAAAADPNVLPETPPANQPIDQTLAGSTECGDCGWRWYDNLSFFLGLEGSKQPQDFGVNANFGGRFSVNWGAPLWEEYGIGFQLGTAINATSDAVQVFQRVDGQTGRTQSFTTVGFFQRTESGWKWGTVYDFLEEDYYSDFHLGQWRAKIGYDWTPCDEIGGQASIADHGDNGSFAGAIPIELRPITQGSLYWRHTWETQVETTFWAGMAEGHSRPNLALGDLTPDRNEFVFGADIFVPLNDYLVLFGEANFIMPSASGTVDSYLGFEYYPGGGARHARKNTFAPLFPVANSTSFSVDLVR
jgi:hypothetical protein